MRPRITVVAPSRIKPLEIPEFTTIWQFKDIDISHFLDLARGQCRADKVVEALSNGVKSPTVYVLDCDGYYPGLNFVFGLAVPVLKTAVVFTARLVGPRFEERLVKEITHEAGHLYGLAHCANPSCVMYFSNSLLDTDRKSPYFCPKCREKLARIL
ncbi:archaemetzincin family Zn-dependent metalloprotease [Pyrobaculum aerophilum]|uniref:Archaemetzincin n=1 Tax=Pyrobaculum aerophilum TaxID=13773 RepID=A0A371QU36_9CREN|nr:archaemetzincin family Zn-dependent metalloprotease [Pyrobaculum aerophilum]RFA92381.1 archemetzincin [Pyrobaculum aerophilum]RFA99439.1 archemetzincin [Pyrobaculum aerophilum]